MGFIAVMPLPFSLELTGVAQLEIVGTERVGFVSEAQLSLSVSAAQTAAAPLELLVIDVLSKDADGLGPRTGSWVAGGAGFGAPGHRAAAATVRSRVWSLAVISSSHPSVQVRDEEGIFWQTVVSFQ